MPADAQVGEAQVRAARPSSPRENTILLNVGHCFRDQVLESCPELNRVRRAHDAHQFARDRPQHGRVGPRHLGAAARRADAEVPQPAGRAGAVREAGAVAPRRARLPAQLSAAGGDRRDARGGRRVPAGWRDRTPTSPGRVAMQRLCPRHKRRSQANDFGSQGQGRAHHRRVDRHRRRGGAGVRAAGSKVVVHYNASRDAAEAVAADVKAAGRRSGAGRRRRDRRGGRQAHRRARRSRRSAASTC